MNSMITLTIDNQEVSVDEGATVLDAARALGIEIPTLCHWGGCTPQTSCMVCLVKVEGMSRMLPSCATPAAEGMRVQSQTSEVIEARRTALELLLAEHLGDCLAPCQLASAHRVHIPQLLRQVMAGDMNAAIKTLTAEVALPAILTRIEDEPAEKACRRMYQDAAVAIGAIERHVADANLAAGPRVPQCAAATGKRVAVIGAGVAGLSAAYFLQRSGHACTLFDRGDWPGGKLRGVPEDLLHPHVAAKEIGVIAKMGVVFEMKTAIGSQRPLAELAREYDAVVVAAGESFSDNAAAPNIFRAGAAHRPGMSALRAAADGKDAASRVDQFLNGRDVTGLDKPFSTRMGRPTEDDVKVFMHAVSPARRWTDTGDRSVLTDEQAAAEAARCMHCDCRKADNCRLRDWSDALDAAVNRYHLPRPPFAQDLRHADVIYEAGKCIKCGLCVAICQQDGEPLGLSITGRGFNVEIAVPFDKPLSDAFTNAAQACIEACPTGALAFKE
ncbi:MAG: FAD-dependent oxidoreductase [Planctomycetaceae bacterium]|nr:FAD-dependent oxidoreductase [Planctomycetaceae bacterium]